MTELEALIGRCGALSEGRSDGEEVETDELEVACGLCDVEDVSPSDWRVVDDGGDLGLVECGVAVTTVVVIILGVGEG